MASQTPEQQILPASLRSSRSKGLTRSAKRFTPYRSAVSSRRRSVTQPVTTNTFSPGARGQIRRSTQSDVTQELINKTWRIHRVSPLYNLSYRPAHLKQYAKALAMFIEADSRKGSAVGDDNVGGLNGSKVVEFTTITSLRSNSDDKNALKIVVKNKPGSDGRTKDTPLLTAYLCCVEMTDSVSRNVPTEFSFLPVLLVKSAVMLSRALVQFLQRRFDCVIRDLTLTTTDMHWLFTITAGYVPEKLESKPAELLYMIGKQITGIDKVTLSIDAKHCQKLIHSVCSEDSTDLNRAEKDRVILALEQHFQAHFRLNLNNLKLQRIATPAAVVGAEGRVKMYSSERVLQVLSFLTTLCCEYFEKVTGTGLEYSSS